MARALRIAVLLLVLAGALPYPIAAAEPLDVSFEVVRETPVGVTIRATISGATGPLDVTCRVDALARSGAAEPTVRGVQVDMVERVAEYRDTPQYETKRIPIAEAIAAKQTEIAALKVTKGFESDEIDARREERHGKETELAALTAEEVCGATHVEETQVVAHRYTLETRERLARVASCNEGDTIMLPAQAARESPPGLLISENELALDTTLVNWGDGVRVYEYTIQTDELRDADGWGSAGILVLTVNGQDYWDDTNSSWWDSAWPYRMKLTIDNSASAENLIDFPLLVKLTPARFDYSFAQVDGDDIRFVDADGTALDYEVDTWTLDGESFFWVRVPQIDALSTTDYIWMYYGTAAVGAGDNPAGVWDDSYVAVYHMNDDPADSTQILDSTSNANTGTKGAGAAAPTEVAGLVGMAQEFRNADATTITIPNSAAFNLAATGGTLVALFEPDSCAGLYDKILSRFIGGAPGAGYYLGFGSDGRSRNEWRATPSSRGYTSAVLAGGPHLVIWSMPAKDAGNERFLLDGVIVKDVAQSDTLLDNTVSNLYLGSQQGVSCFDGLIDELRLSSVARSAEWIEAEYLSMWDAMLTYGDTEGYEPEPEEEPVVPLATVLVIVAIGVAAVRQRHIILYTAAFILFLFAGLAAADESLMLGIPVVLYAGYFLFAITMLLWRR